MFEAPNVGLHMPPNVRVWYVNSGELEHTFRNPSNIVRCHLLVNNYIMDGA